MTNHVHMLIEVGDTPLGRLMLHIAGRYARSVQAHLHTTGHLFEKRYYPVLVDADEYLLQLLRYIHLNPVRARMVTCPSDYPWSSHHAYLGEAFQPWVTTERALSMFHRHRDNAIAAYRRFIDNSLADPVTSPLSQCNPSDRRILGSDAFAGRLLGAAWRPKSPKSLDTLIAEACQQFTVTSDALLSPGRQRHLARVRAWVAYQALTLRVASLSEVARIFHRNEASLREGVKRHFNYP